MTIGVFDSGLGGLTIVQSLQKYIKGIEIFYIADTQNAPYGEKSPNQILEYSLKVSQYLIENHEIDALILACNTATSFAIKVLRTVYPTLIIIGSEPAIRPATLLSKTGNIGVLATFATLKGEKYEALVHQLSENPSIRFFPQACHGLVEQIEKGEVATAKTKKMLEHWLLLMQENTVDTIVLGCTHYPLVSTLIYEIMGEDICLLDTADAIAKHLLERLEDEKNHQNRGALSIYVGSTGHLNRDLVQNILNLSVQTERVIL
jgi:glutamate racemase